MSRYILPVTSIIQTKPEDKQSLNDIQPFGNIYEKNLSDMEGIHVIDFVKNTERKTESKNSNSCNQSDSFFSYPILAVDGPNIYTGKYIGELHLKKNTITIDTGYQPELLFRMLDVVNNIYVDRNHSDKLLYNKEALPRFIIEYLFVTSLNKLLMNGIPREYRKITYKGSNIRGKINISKYINVEMQRSATLTQTVKELLPVQDICDVIHQALKLTKSVGIDGYAKAKNIFASLCSDKIVTTETIRRAKQHKILFNPMYAGYKQVLHYADIIINNLNPGTGDNSTKNKVSGFLIDIAELWELYLEKLLKNNLHGWDVIPQPSYEICTNSFFKRSIRPDFVLKNIETGQIAVLDAKFKKMKFDNNDVDREDLYQIAFYSSYFHSRQNNPFNTVTFLVYPLSERKSTKGACDSMLFHDNLDTPGQNISIAGIFVGEKNTELQKEESKKTNSKESQKNQKQPQNSQENAGKYNITTEEQEFISRIISNLERIPKAEITAKME